MCEWANSWWMRECRPFSPLRLPPFPFPHLRYGIEGPVLLNPKGKQPSSSQAKAGKPTPSLPTPGSQWVVNEREQAMQSIDGSRSFRVLDAVRVRIEVTEPEPHRPKLTLSLVEV